MKASITIDIFEFDDFLYETVDGIIQQHGKDIAEYLQSFLLGVGSVNLVLTSGKNLEWRI